MGNDPRQSRVRKLSQACMRVCRIVTACLLFGVASGGNGAAPSPTPAHKSFIGVRPVFVADRLTSPGAESRFVSHGANLSLSLSADRIEMNGIVGLRTDAVVMRLKGGRPLPIVSGERPIPDRWSFWRGGDRHPGARGAPAYQAIRYREVYPGIDLVFHGDTGETEYDFIVGPQADPSAIRLEFAGAKDLILEKSGDLRILLPGDGVFRQRKPALYQIVNGIRRSVEGRFIVRGRVVGFQVGRYDRRHPLVIDPVLSYSSVWGLKEADYPVAAGRDGQNNLYLLMNAPYGFGSTDLLVIKLSPTGDRLLGGVFLGEAGAERGIDMAVDADGSVIVYAASDSHDREDTPNTDEGFPLTLNAYLPRDVPEAGAVLVKIDPSLENLVYSTRFHAFDDGAVALGPRGSIYITGRSRKPALGTPGAHQVNPGCPEGSPFVARFDLNRSGVESLVYATYIGGAVCGSGFDLVVTRDESAYVTGVIDGPLNETVGAPQPVYGGGLHDAFVVKVAPAGDSLRFSTHLGGEGDDAGRGITLDAEENLVVAGETFGGFPTTANSAQPRYEGGVTQTGHGFAVKYRPDGTIAYSTYLGGSGNDRALTVATDRNGCAYVAGSTDSTDMALIQPVQVRHGGGSDGFLKILNPSGSRFLFSTYLGGAALDDIRAIAIDDAGQSVYLLGSTDSPEFPLIDALLLGDLPGNAVDRKNFVTDVYLARIDIGPLDDAPATASGDLNGDGRVSVADATLALHAAIGLITLTPEQVIAADMDANGRISAADATRILRKAVGLE